MKRISSILLLFVAMATLCGTANAQDDKTRREARKQFAEKQARHIAGELAMDDATSRKFIDAYSQCQTEVWEAGKQMRGNRHTKPAEMTEAQARQAIKNRFDHSRKVLEIRQKYYERYSQFLTQKQIHRIYELEKHMTNRLVKHGKGKKTMQQRQKRK